MGPHPGILPNPHYDITFKPKKGQEYKRRRRSDAFRDFQMLPPNTTRQLVFLGSKEYLPLFLSLTADITAPKTVFYRSAVSPEAPGCKVIRYRTARRTNWQYECADAFMAGDLEIRFSRSD
jgi:hypothetical protein